METMNALYSRKSIRNYTGDRISGEKLQEIIKAANAAPVGMGKYQNVHLTVVEAPELLKAIDAAAAAMAGDPKRHPLYGAPTFIIISVKPQDEVPSNVEYSNAAIMAHNIILSAVDSGIGCCHIWGAVRALNKEPELVKSLELPDGFVPCCGVILGETEEQYSLRDIPENRVTINYR